MIGRNMLSIDYEDVFQHLTQKDEVEKRRNYIINKVYQCIKSNRPIQNSDFNLQLYFGYYNLRSQDVNASLRELIWKHSELTGKYCGCQYWSVGAKSVFENMLPQKLTERRPSLDDAWTVADDLSGRYVDQNQKLVHEHVFPIASLITELLKPTEDLSLGSIEKIIETRAVGCVILKSEDDVIALNEDRVRGDADNLWLRYKKANIKLADNPSWPLSQRELIEGAGLI